VGAAALCCLRDGEGWCGGVGWRCAAGGTWLTGEGVDQRGTPKGRTGLTRHCLAWGEAQACNDSTILPSMNAKCFGPCYRDDLGALEVRAAAVPPVEGLHLCLRSTASGWLSACCGSHKNFLCEDC